MSAPRFPQAADCSACRGNCETPEACMLPIARATKPPRAAFWLDAPRRAWVHLQLACLRWNFDCIGAEREDYQAAGMVGAIYLRESFAQQRVLMTQIRELEAQL